MSALGVTGSRHGLSVLQRGALAGQLHRLFGAGFVSLHHGDCVGVDEEAAKMGKAMGFRLVAHPPKVARLRAFVPSDEVRPVADYLVRDRRLVTETGMLIACPDGPPRTRSGTWYTVRYARAARRPCLIITPDGVVS